ncbi:MAG: arginase family protein, partial [Nitrososphaeraceae archaeon]|nr:arginase family protein [Nitrososphaeraceae archaeon]
IIVGVPDESKSKAPRKGSRNGPDELRKALKLSENFKRFRKIIPIMPMDGRLDNKKILDFGNVKRDNLYETIIDIASKNKIPIVLGGDHSITTTTLKAIAEITNKKINLIYFDAHPDFVTSVNDYYGSVVSDSLDFIDMENTVFVGTRACEPEEVVNLKSHKANVINPLELQEFGSTKTLKKIIDICNPNLKKNQIYISIDLDCLDPVFAPGISVPAPCGLTTLELTFLVKKILEKYHIIGCDIVELSPSYDVNSVTANFSARLLKEILASIRLM